MLANVLWAVTMPHVALAHAGLKEYRLAAVRMFLQVVARREAVKI